MDKIKTYDDLIARYPFLDEVLTSLAVANKQAALIIYQLGFTDGMDRALELRDAAGVNESMKAANHD